MKRLIDQLMLLAQMDAEDATHLRVERVILSDVCADDQPFGPAIIRSGRTIALEGEDLEVTVLGRREAIAAALRNLVENGNRVTPVGGTILIRVTLDACIHVRDGGEGLTRMRLNELIKRNRRSDNANPDGAGLGLAIVARIMAAHGGELTSDPYARELTLRFPKTLNLIPVRKPSALSIRVAAMRNRNLTITATTLCLTLVRLGDYFLAGNDRVETAEASGADSPRPGKMTENQIRRLGIETVFAEVATSVPMGSVPATVTLPPEASVAVTAPFTGSITQLYVVAGQAVSRGQPLCVLEKP